MKKSIIIAAVLAAPFTQANELKNFSAYGKLALGFFTNEGKWSTVDNGSRLGFKYKKDDIFKNVTIGARGEYSVQATKPSTTFAVKGDNFETTSTDGPFKNRLGYIYFDFGKNFTASFGKQWSPYYDVTSVTDIFNMFGAEASGAFSFNSDGGFLGTGRADNSSLFTYKNKNMKASFIYIATNDQEIELTDASGNSLPGTPKRTYERAMGGAFEYDHKYFQIGLAHIHGDITEVSLSKDTKLTTAGLQLKLNPVTIGVVYTESRFSELDDNGVIFDARGTEAVIDYALTETISLRAGYNNLKPHEDTDYQELTDHFYEIKKYIVGAQYSKDNLTLGLEGLIDESQNADDTKTKNSIAGFSMTLNF